MLMSPLWGRHPGRRRFDHVVWPAAAIVREGCATARWAGLVVPAAAGGWTRPRYIPPAAAVRGGLALRRIRGLVGRPGACGNAAVEGRPGCAVIVPADPGGGTGAQTRTAAMSTAETTARRTTIWALRRHASSLKVGNCVGGRHGRPGSWSPSCRVSACSRS